MKQKKKQKMNEIEEIIIHYVGNKTREEGVIVSDSAALLKQDLKEILGHSLLAQFKYESLFCFFHE